MLVLSRRESESLVIGADVTVRVLSIKGSRVRLGIDAPESVAIKRNELVIDLDGASASSGFASLQNALQPQLCE